MILARVSPENVPRIGLTHGDKLKTHAQEKRNDDIDLIDRQSIRCCDIRAVSSSLNNFPPEKEMFLYKTYKSKLSNNSKDDCNLAERSNEDTFSNCPEGTIEEIWLIGNKRVEWRKGGKAVKVFTGENTVLQALWTKFINDCKTASTMECIVIREKERLRVHSDGGQEHFVALPFELRKVWNTMFGLLLEKSEDPNSKNILAYSSHAGLAQELEGNRIKPPKLMALHHPLDDLTRVVIKTEVDEKKKFSEWNCNRHTILFTSTKPSICLTFDNVTGHHHIWHIRQIYESDDFNEDLIENSQIDSGTLKEHDKKKKSEITPSQQSNNLAGPTLFSNLLNNTRLKQFHKKQNTPSSGIPSASGSPLLSSHCSPSSTKPTPNISANSCVMQQQRSQNTSSINNSLSAITGTSTRRHTPVTSSTTAGPFTFPDSPLTPHQVQHEVATNCSTREFMMRQGTPIRVSNPNLNINVSKQSQYINYGTPTRLGSLGHEVQNTTNILKPHGTPLHSNNATNAVNNRFVLSRDCESGGSEQPLAPDFSICLDLIWSEKDVDANRSNLFTNELNSKETGNQSNQASKVFLSSDIIGNRYICMFHEEKGIIKTLPFHEVKNTLGQPNKFVFGDIGHIGSLQSRTILDCVPIESQGMILTIEKNKSTSETNNVDNSQQCTNICLYTGCSNENKVADVHIEPFYSSVVRKGDLANIAHEISALHLDGQQKTMTSIKENTPSWKDKKSNEIVEVERKEIITSSRPSSATGFQAFNESILSMLSPVAKSDQNLLGFPSVLCKSISKDGQNEIQHSASRVEFGAYSHAKLLHNNLRLLLTMPPICTSSLVDRCLKSIYAYLPNRLSVSFAIKWYRMRNAPGPSSISTTEEWKLFVKCLFIHMGYRVDKMQLEEFTLSTLCRSGNDSSVSPVYSKKMRPDESGSDEDWQALLESKPHMQSGGRLSSVLRIPDVLKNPIASAILEDRKDKELKENYMDIETVLIDTNAILFESIGSILWCLHLLYEDFKLEKTSLEYLSSLSVVLSKLAGDLNLNIYVEHYWQDFPTNCPKAISAAQTGQMLPQYLPLISKPFITMKNGNSSLTRSHTTPPCIYSQLIRLLTCENMNDNSSKSSDSIERYEVLRNGATRRSCDLIMIYAMLSFKRSNKSHFNSDSKIRISDYLKLSASGQFEENEQEFSNVIELVRCTEQSSDNIDVASSIVKFVVDQGYSTWSLMNTFPEILALPVFGAIFECRLNPRLKDSTWAKEAYRLIGRPDLAKQCMKSTKPLLSAEDNGMKDNFGYNDEPMNSNMQIDDAQINIEPSTRNSEGGSFTTTYDGLEEVESEITRLRWPSDRRVADVRRMLQSARPVLIDVEQRPEMSDHDFVEVQERALQSLCIRTMALPIGRGAIGFRTTYPLPTETLPVPKLCLSGRAPPRGAAVEMDHIDVVPNMERWPSFHNGVAAGLRIASENKTTLMDSNWITFNKPKDSSSNPNELVEHGGFLMALGLNGQLAALGKLESFDYLIRGNDMISIGILLGTCAAKRGSMDILATKKIATQVEALLPSTATELPLSNTTQVAGLAGLGLLYQGTGHRQMSEVCLMELGRPPGPEMENCTDRESYSLSAGLSLGMITLGKGETLNKGPLSDLRLPETLYHHMVGGPRSPSMYRHRFRSPSSYQIQEGETINIDITSPGATLALGLMFFNSGNKTYANWMNAPDSQFLLEFVRPDFLMVRTLAKGLIMWDSIVPHASWIESHVPPSIREYCLRRPGDDFNSGQIGSRGMRGAIDYETINQAYCNIVAGAALAMGLRFAGSNNSKAFDVLHQITLRLLAITKRSVAELAGKATIEQTICVLVLSMSIVAAGSGDLEVIRIIRLLRSRVGPKNPTVTYGSHMALHMALGLLFFGGGRYTLSTSPEAVAAMVAAFFPKFPTHSNDNRYHLQALRHLYVLAAEPRLLIPRDIHSCRFVFCHIEVQLKETQWYKKCSYVLKAPAFLPEMKYLKRVSVRDPRYHDMVFDISSSNKTTTSSLSEDNNFAQLRALIQDGRGIIDIQQKAGSLSYVDDPQGFRSLTGQCLTKNTSFRWNISLNSSRLLSTFSLEPAVAKFSSLFIKKISGLWDIQSNGSNPLAVSAIEQKLASILYECASQEKLDMLPFYLKLFQDVWNVGQPGQLLYGHQIRLLLNLTSQKFGNSYKGHQLVNRLVNPEVVKSVYQGLRLKLDQYIERYGIREAEQFLTNGKFNDNFYRLANVSAEVDATKQYHILTDSAAKVRSSFANLLVFHRLFERSSNASIKAFLLHDDEEWKTDNEVNPVRRLIQNKFD